MPHTYHWRKENWKFLRCRMLHKTRSFHFIYFFLRWLCLGQFSWRKLLSSRNEKDNIISDTGKWFWITCLRRKHEEDTTFSHWVVGKRFCRLFLPWSCVVHLITNWNDVFTSYSELLWGSLLEYSGRSAMACISHWKPEYPKSRDGSRNSINLLDSRGKRAPYEMSPSSVTFTRFVNLNRFIFTSWSIAEGHEKQLVLNECLYHEIWTTTTQL